MFHFGKKNHNQVTNSLLLNYKLLREKALFIGSFSWLIRISFFFFSIQFLNVSVNATMSVNHSLKFSLSMLG